ncbi:MAG TPA: ABC transporter permease, partial [Candidatus Limnocylindrales bacterium]|nr:ABC transporter permease [Candidatus Limnocylindrales bacterium]
MTGALAGYALRGLLGQRRAWLVLLLAAVPVVVGLLATLSGTSPGPRGFFGNLVIRTVLPLVCLLLGTAALGSDIDDGTIVYLLVKPIARWRLAIVKLAVAAGLAAALGALTTVVSGLIIGAPTSQTWAFAAGAVGAGLAYTAIFLALSLVTRHALIIGLLYVLVWEGVLSGLLEGIRILSIREFSLAIADGLSGGGAGSDAVTTPTTAALVLAAVVVVA